MIQTLHALFDGITLVPEEVPLNITSGTRVRIIVESHNAMIMVII
jgi:hypothetical protein